MKRINYQGLKPLIFRKRKSLFLSLLEIKLLLIGLFFLFFLFPKITSAVTPRECIQICVDKGGTPYACADQCGVNTSRSTDIFGKIPLPSPLAKFKDVNEGGIGNFLNVIFKTIVIGAAIYSLFNLLTAGYAFMGAAEDPKKIAGAWQKIWQTLLGLALTAGAFVLAAIFGQLIFGDPNFILNPSIPTP